VNDTGGLFEEPVRGLPFAPRDPDGDGLYQDVNGDGSQDLGDVFDLAFVVLPSTGELSPAQEAAFDFDGDGELTFDDVFALAFGDF
jgi:hypothetical protein